MKNNSSSITFLASNATFSGSDANHYYGQWYIAGSNDNSTWTKLYEQTHKITTDYNATVTVNINGYKYLKFGSGNGNYNYLGAVYYKNIVWS